MPYFTLKFAAAQQGADISVTNFVQLFSDWGQTAWFKDSDNNTCTALFFRATTFYTKLHAFS
ncbi:hypothetical protein JY98_19360 [Exiguobacterium mexicanum]|nr:hypothetical protein JY98_19360 [Exiguobacterium mexicanum]